MMGRHDIKQLAKRPSEQTRKTYAEYLRLRIYSSITLMAVNVGLLAQENVSVQHALIAIAATVSGLWLASIFAAIMSYRVVNDKNIPRKTLMSELVVHRGLISPVITSLIMLGLAGLDIIEVQTALMADIVLSVIALTIGILRSAKTATNTLNTAIVSVIVQAVFAALVVAVKYKAH